MSWLNDLHARYDGAIPAAVRELARHGSREGVALARAHSRIISTREGVMSAVRTMRACRMALMPNPIALSAVHDARREHRQAWRELRAIEAEISSAEG